MSDGLDIKVDLGGLQKLAHLIEGAGEKAPIGIARAIRHTGDKGRTRMVRALTAQTGLKRGTIDRARLRLGSPGIPPV